MKTIIKSLLAAATVSIASSVSALNIPASGTIQLLQDTQFDGGLTGGEFSATIPGFGHLYTFCLELNQTITFPGTYDFETSNATDSNNDPISKGTALLYRLFQNGTLYDRNGTTGNTSSGGDKTNVATNSHDFNAGLLQAAIWYLEEEVNNGWTHYNTFIDGNPFLALVEGIYNTIDGAKGDYTGSQVKVLNITSNNGNTMHQDLLIGVPDSGTTLAFLGLALAGLATVRRRFKA